jgi:hypothetical protein
MSRALAIVNRALRHRIVRRVNITRGREKLHWLRDRCLRCYWTSLGGMRPSESARTMKRSYLMNLPVAVVLVAIALLGGCATTIVTETFPPNGEQNSDSPKSLMVDCPPGMTAKGGGARIYGVTQSTALTASGPEGSPTAPTAWFGVAQEVGPGTDKTWGLRVDVFCQ